MAHIRKNCVNVSTTYSAPAKVLEKVDDYRFDNRKDNRSAAITELILMGLKYKAIVEKKKEKVLV